MKLLGIIDEEPFDPRTWSGSSKYFFGALQDRGALLSAAAVVPGAAVRRFHQALSIQPDLKRWRFRYHLSLGYYAAMTRRARRLVARIPSSQYDAILQVGAWYDLTHSGGKPTVSYHDGNLAALLKSPYGYPQIADRHIRAALEYERSLYSRLNLIFPMSEWLAASFVKDNGVDRRKVFPVGAGINLPHVRTIDNKSYDAPRLLFVGKDFKRKGGAVLLEAFRLVRREIPDAELTIVGTSLPSPPAGVRCLGPLAKSNPADVERLLTEYERATLFVMPSLYEPFGVVFGEAMAHRLPCIGTSICAMPEIIEHGATGFVVPPNDAAALARHILALLKDPEMARQFGDRGYRRYQANYTWEAVTGKMCAVIAHELGIR